MDSIAPDSASRHTFGDAVTYSRQLSEFARANVLRKLENLQETGTIKLRGARTSYFHCHATR